MTSPKNPFPTYGTALLWGQNKSKVVKRFEKGKALKFKIVLLFGGRCFPSKKRKKKIWQSLQAISRKWFSAGFCLSSPNPGTGRARRAAELSPAQKPEHLQDSKPLFWRSAFPKALSGGPVSHCLNNHSESSPSRAGSSKMQPDKWSEWTPDDFSWGLRRLQIF